MQRTCDQCQAPILGRGIRFCSPSCSKAWHKADYRRRHPEKNRAYVKASVARNRKRVNRYNADRRKRLGPRFIGVDCEAIDNKLVMISAGDQHDNHWSIVTPKGQELTTHQALTFLCELPKGIKCGFWFEYDVNMILRDLSREHLEKLRDKGRCYWGVWSIHHIPGKQFRVHNRVDQISCVIWDFSNFVRTSFVKMLRAWKICDEAKIAEIEAMKDLRSEFAWKMIKRIAKYNEDECTLLAQSAVKIWQAAKDAGVTLRTYYGGGSIASELMRKNDVKAYSEEWDNDLAEKAYYGGRFETSIIGLIKGPIWVYDINSAYPHTASLLPSLRECRWVRRHKPRLGYGLHYVHWNVPNLWGPFPVRRQVGSLCYPSNGYGWYWYPEVEAAIALYGDAITILKTYSLIITDPTMPFDWIKAEASHRLALKESGDFGAQILKLGLNSVYGKLAQRVGRAPFHNSVWAGLITSGTRAMLLNAIAKAPDDVISMATDSVFSRVELDLPISPNLGDWEVKQVEWIFFAQGGVYFWPEDDGIIRKSRGFSGKGLTYELVKAEWDKNGIEGIVQVPQHRFIGYRTGLRQEGTWRTWVDSNRRLRFDPRPRRIPTRMEAAYCITRPPTSTEVKMSEILDIMTLEVVDEWEEIREQPEPPFGDSII